MIRSLCILIFSATASMVCAEDHRVFELPFAEGRLEASRHGGPAAPIYVEKVSSTDGPDGRPAISVPLEGQLIYEGSGNFYIPTGAVSFWWRADNDPLKVETEVLGLSGLQRFYFCRWLQITTRGQRIGVTLYHGNSAHVFEDDGSVPPSERPRKKVRHELTSQQRVQKGRWYHIAVTWDMGRGVALYVDGALSRQVRLPWYYGGNVNHISLGCSSTSYSKPRIATFPQSFSALTIYDCWLEPDEVAKIAKGEKVEPKGDIAPMLAQRSRRTGLGVGLKLPVASLATAQKETLRLSQVGVPVAYDVLRRSYAAVDGDPGRAWPMYQGYSNSGENLRVVLASKPALTDLQALGSGLMQFETVTADGTRATVAKLETGTPTLISTEKGLSEGIAEVNVRRQDGVLFHLALLNRSQQPFPAEGQEGWRFFSLAQGETTAAPRMVEEFAPYDRTLLVAGSESEKNVESITLPSGRAVHLLGPAVVDREGLGAFALDLAVKSAPAGVDATLMVIDPVNDYRRTFLANARFEQEEAGAGRARIVVDLRDLVFEKGERPWLVLVLSDDVEIDPAASRVGLQVLPVEVAKVEFIEDQWAVVQDDFQERSEGRPWSHDPQKLKLLGSLLKKIDVVRALKPGDPIVDGYWHWTHPSEPPPAVKLPKPAEGQPEWAFYTHRAVGLFRDAAHWWIDSRQTESGEFGAPDGINDDTDLIQDWLAIDLMNGPDEKIRRSVDKVADISWRLKTTDGVSNQITDTLHIYEWGINAQTMAFVMRYGDPVYYTRLLRFASYYPKLMMESCNGKHLHFKSWYFGASRVITEGIYGRDILLNALLLQPAMLLAWYNGDEESTRLVTRWTDSMRDHVEERVKQTSRVPGVAVDMPSGKSRPESHLRASFPEAVWAAYDLSGDKRYLDFLGTLIDAELTRPPLRDVNTTAFVAPGYLAASKDARWDRLWVEKAEDPALWQKSIHNSNYRQLNLFFSNWLRSGDDRWINDGSRLALYHLTWSMPMLTEAEATTDRVWLPQSLANMTMLGDLSILRNRIYPRQAVSWENADGAFSPLVREHGADRLKVEMWNLEERPVKVQARVWGLAAGEYEVVLTPQLPSEAEAQEPTKRREELERYSLLPLELAAKGRLVMEIRQLRHDGDHRKRTDLAVSPLDAIYLPEKKQLICTVYNIGVHETGEYEVSAVNPAGRVLLSEKFSSLPPPKDYRTATQRIEIAVENPEEAITLVVKGKAREITLHNNRVTLIPIQLPSVAP